MRGRDALSARDDRAHQPAVAHARGIAAGARAPGRGGDAPFSVTSADLAVSPTSIAGIACGSAVTLTYTATFSIAAGGPGGEIHFEYTMNNGRGSTNASISVAAGQTIATYSFTWSGELPADHIYPVLGGVIVTSPNQVTSSLVAPTGSCA